MNVKLHETFREAVPAHFLFRIESFSLLSKNDIVKYESNEFEIGGYKWRLSFYPVGNKNENGNGHILCVYVDMEGKTSRFHEMKKVHGFPQFLPLAKFKKPSNGYLVDDTCVFGAEVFVYKPIGNIECLSMVNQSTAVTHTWKITKFSEIKEEILKSENFKAGDQNWNIQMYPKGSSVGKKNKSVSLYLNSVDIEGKPGLKVYADFKLGIKDQINGKHKELSQGNHWFQASRENWGWPQFIGLSEMNNKGKGYLENDTCIVEAEVKVLGKVIPK